MEGLGEEEETPSWNHQVIVWTLGLQVPAAVVPQVVSQERWVASTVVVLYTDPCAPLPPPGVEGAHTFQSAGGKPVPRP